MQPLERALCRVYTISCPICGLGNTHLRLKQDIYHVKTREPDGHPMELTWKVPDASSVNPLAYFWGTCKQCFFTREMDDAEFRRSKENLDVYRSHFLENFVSRVADQAQTKMGFLQELGKGIDPSDPFGAVLIRFLLGIYSECMKGTPFYGNLGRYYLRIAWLYRDREKYYPETGEVSRAPDFLTSLREIWQEELPPHTDYPVLPGIPLEEADALRFAMDYFERNFEILEKTKLEDELRLLLLISEIGYRLYTLANREEDYKRTQGYFSAAMQKALGIVNDKSISGGVVNRARDTLEKAGDRGRQLRILHQKRSEAPKARPKTRKTGLKKKTKRRPKSESRKPPQRQSAPVQKSQEPEPKSAPIQKSQEPEPKSAPVQKSQEPEPKPSEAEAPPSPVPNQEEDERDQTIAQRTQAVQVLRQTVKRLEEENKRWRRLASISELTGLPNRVLFDWVLLPDELKTAISQRIPLSCIMLGPDNMRPINAEHGRLVGDTLIKQFAEFLRGQIVSGEQLGHLDRANFVILSPCDLEEALQKAEQLKINLQNHPFKLKRNPVSITATIGVASSEQFDQQNVEQIKQAIIHRLTTAFDTAKMSGGDRIGVARDPSESV